MSLLNENDRARQAARTWSGKLGSLAAELPATRPDAAFNPLDTAPPFALPTRLSSILNYLRQQARRRESAADKLRANEFMAGP
jgi:hypothetical protein